MPLLGQNDPRFRVIYPDGLRSELMNESTAQGYRNMFGGKVECVKPKSRARKIIDAARDFVIVAGLTIAVILAFVLIFVAGFYTMID